MIARFDHRPKLTALLALSTTVLVVVVVTLATLLITSAPPAATSSSVSDGGNPGNPVPHLAGGAAAAPADRMDAGGEGYGMPIKANAAQPAQTGDSVERHHKIVGDYLSAASGPR